MVLYFCHIYRHPHVLSKQFESQYILSVNEGSSLLHTNMTGVKYSPFPVCSPSVISVEQQKFLYIYIYIYLVSMSHTSRRPLHLVGPAVASFLVFL